MSQAIASVTLTRILGGEVYASLITCNKGDLFQRYNTDRVAPDWETDTTKRPVLTYHCASSAAAGQTVIPDKIELYYDGTKVTFNAGQSTSADGRFLISGGGTQPWQVTCLKNFCTKGATAQAGHNIKIVGFVGLNTFPAAIPVDIQPLTENGEEVHIIGSGANPFVVDQNTGSSCQLIARVYSGGTEVSAGNRTFKWEKQTAAGWAVIAGATTDTLTVTASDVDAYAVYRVTVTNPATGESHMDTQSVMDVGDPFFVGISITDGTAAADAQFPVGAPSSAKRVFTASLLARRTGATVPAYTCRWQLMRPDGTLLNSSFTGGTDSHGVIDMTQNSRTISVTCGFMADNSVDTINVTAIVEFTV